MKEFWWWDCEWILAVGSIDMDGQWMQDYIGELLQISAGGRETDRLRANAAGEDGRQSPDTCSFGQRHIHHDHLQGQKQAEDWGAVPAARPLRRLLRPPPIPYRLLLLFVGISKVKVLICFSYEFIWLLSIILQRFWLEEFHFTIFNCYLDWNFF